ncbi:MAG: YihY/virulence factor BrkB family protein [Longimicrobiales bacterium]|nr:YihY/virulence factor BrkB family protein [Longimicrobiales bacterium]
MDDPGPEPGPTSTGAPIPAPAAGEKSRLRRVREYTAALGRGIWRKGEQDNIFFLAGAISFDVMVAFIPLLVAVVGIAGTVLQRRQQIQEMLLQYLDQTIPAAVNLPYERVLTDLAQNSTGILSIGTLLFLWISTRLVGTLRIVLREIFDMPHGRGIVEGKIFDVKMVLMAGTLFGVNFLLTVGLRLGAEFASEATGIQTGDVPLLSDATALWPQLLAFVTLWFMFFLIYRYLPPRRIQWRTAAIAATFTAIVAEILKFGFTWYVQNVAVFDEFWGNVATFVILVLWIYYTSLVFVLGGEVAQVVSMQRTRKRQKLRLS